MFCMCCANTCTIHMSVSIGYTMRMRGYQVIIFTSPHLLRAQPELVYAVTPNLNCIVGLYRNARHFQLACLELSNDLLAKNGNHKKCQLTVWVSHQVSHDVEV